VERREFVQLLVGSVLGTLLIVGVLCLRMAPIYKALVTHQAVADTGVYPVRWPSKFFRPVIVGESMVQH
jgi:hypothetical protein